MVGRCDPRVTVLNDDAYTFVDNTEETWSVIIMDFPDPHGEALAKLYSVRLSSDFGITDPDGVAVHWPRLLILREKRFGAFASDSHAGFHASVPMGS